MQAGEPTLIGTPADLLSFCDQVLATVAADRGIDATVGLLRQRVAAPVAILDTRGSVLVQSPSRMSWPAGEILRLAQIGDQTDSGPTANATEPQIAPIKFGTQVVAVLCSTCSPDHLPVLGLGARVIGLELARLQANQSGHYDLVTQLLEDIVAGAIPDWDARRRLARFGVNTDDGNYVVVGRNSGDPERLTGFPWNLHQLIARQPEPYLRSRIGDRMVLIVPAGDAVDALAQRMLRHLNEVGRDARVGISGAYPGVTGLRIGLPEAIDAMERGAGVHYQDRVNMGSAVISASLDLPMYELARAVLKPLLDYDAQHDGNLVETLRAYLKHDCATGPAAEELFIHRNTLRYRLSLIEKLTDRTISSFTDRVHFWLATALLQEREQH